MTGAAAVAIVVAIITITLRRHGTPGLVNPDVGITGKAMPSPPPNLKQENKGAAPALTSRKTTRSDAPSKARDSTTPAVQPTGEHKDKVAALSGPPGASTSVNSKDSLTYVSIPPGKFMMGCSPGDGDCDDAEKVRHEVTISNGFWIGQTEVTQEAYQHVVGSNPSTIKGAKLPVETVSWAEADAYCHATGGRLPTEAEWEYASRGGDTSTRYGFPDAVAWYGGFRDPQAATHEVGQKLANGFGLYDTLGNVAEWVADWYARYPSDPVVDPRGPTSGQERVVRGGSFLTNVIYIRVSHRSGYMPETRDAVIGFRCARK
jgi:formylglycine-generating enzyme required for sulfatase activity